MVDVAITSAGRMVGVSKKTKKVWYCDDIPCRNGWYEDKTKQTFQQVSISTDGQYIYGIDLDNNVYQKEWTFSSVATSSWKPFP